MKIFNGKKEAQKILTDLKNKIGKNKITPKLAVISVKADSASKLFIKNKKAAAEKIGMDILEYRFRENAKEADVIGKIDELNMDDSVHGVIVQLPLPVRFNPTKIIGRISGKKDVDGFSGGKRYFEPPLPKAIFYSLKAALRTFSGKDIVCLVNSDIFGKTLKTYFKKKRIKVKYLLRTGLNGKSLKEADVVITVCGRPGLIKGEYLKKGVVLIDAGISLSLKGKILGDVDKDSILNKASFLTPVPGGIGPLNVAFLLNNIYLSSVKL